MLYKTWLNVIFDEMFFYEYQRCQMRASFFINKNYSRRQFSGIKNKIESVKGKSYIPYDDTLVYSIRKKILFYAINAMDKEKEIDANYFKKFSAIIIEKEISDNKKKTNRKTEYYNKIKNIVSNGLNEFFELINVNDFDYSVKTCFRETLILPELIELIRNGVSNGTSKSIPNFDYKDEYPLLRQDILALTFNPDTGCANIVTTQIFDITEEMCHRNFLIKLLFRHFYSMKDNLNYELGIEINYIDKITIYNPLTLKVIDVYFEDVKSSLAEMDLFRIMSAYIDNNLARTLDTNNCEFCENNKICFSKTRSRNKMAIAQTFEAKRARGRPTEAI